MSVQKTASQEVAIAASSVVPGQSKSPSANTAVVGHYSQRGNRPFCCPAYHWLSPWCPLVVTSRSRRVSSIAESAFGHRPKELQNPPRAPERYQSAKLAVIPSFSRRQPSPHAEQGVSRFHCAPGGLAGLATPPGHPGRRAMWYICQSFHPGNSARDWY